jgi:hypothetical protein
VTSGYHREHVKEIARLMITKVGESDLSAEQWLAIAPRYAERLAL